VNFKLKAHHKILIGAILFLWLLYLVIPIPNPLFKNDYSTVVLDKDGQILRLFLNQDEQLILPPDKSQKIPAKLKQAVLFFEDRYFKYHPGINPVSILRAIKQNTSTGKIVSGASTITMQLARLMKPKSRTFTHKLLEMLQALKIELKFSKAEILQSYLNHAPYGGNIIGFRAASLRYFRKFPQELTWAESATLAVLPNAPALISPQQNPDILKRKRDRLLERMYKVNIIDQETYSLAILESAPQNSYPLEMQAAHLARSLKTKYPNKHILHTTIDIKLQQTVKDIIQNQQRHLSSLGISNLCALIVETQSGVVRAYLGSANFNTSRVDGIRAARSSGSILKPFLYALSMDEGLILPETLIKDIPTYFGPFSPANADEKYRGVVSAKQALIQSLNVPATRLLNKFGLEIFYHFLKQAGLSTLFRKAENYGLPLIIGGAEVTPWDMAGLYRGLARGGKFSPLKVIKNRSFSHPERSRGMNFSTEKQLISPGAAYLTLNMLNEVKRPGTEYYWQQYLGQRSLAWKTGTSYGQRDAWAVGVNQQWTIVVWAGNFDGLGNANLSGVGSAGPVLFDIFQHLPEQKEKSWFQSPDSALQKTELCKHSGFAAGPYCPERIEVDAPIEMKSLNLCPFHKQITVSFDAKEQVCSLCWDENHKFVTRLIFPPEVEQFLRQSGNQIDNTPPHRKSCPAPPVQKPLKIIYPTAKAFIFLPRDFGGSLQKLNCRAAHQQQGQTIYWYLDTHYLGNSVEQHQKSIELTKGWHKLELVDQDGHKDAVRFYVDLDE